MCGGGLVKLSVRDLGVAVGLRRDGATTVAATAALRRPPPGSRSSPRADSVGCTAGRADLGRLRRPRRAGPYPVLTVCSGVKSILDVPATVELLETLSVPVLGYGTDAFPGFYRRDSGVGCLAGG